MKKIICTMLAVVLILTVCMIPSFAQTRNSEYTGATINVIHCGYNRDWEIDPGMPLGVVEIRTSGSETHKAWTAIRIGEHSSWTEDWGTPGYTSYSYVSILAYGYPDGLETDYCAFYY